MYKSVNIRLKPLVISLLISLGTGGLSALLTRNEMEHYKALNQPPLAPPAMVFPIVWGILFTLMGISAYLVYISHSKEKKRALILYGVQLVMNFAWTLIFFNRHAYLLAFIWLVALWLVILAMIIDFFKVRPLAGWLQIPYLLWVAFAGYLNIMIYFLNK